MPLCECIREDVTGTIRQGGILLDGVEPIDLQISVACQDALLLEILDDAVDLDEESFTVFLAFEVHVLVSFLEESLDANSVHLFG